MFNKILTYNEAVEIVVNEFFINNCKNEKIVGIKTLILFSTLVFLSQFSQILNFL